MSNQRKSHNRKVLECFLELKNDDGSRLLTIMRKYGRKTREEAIEKLYEYNAEKLGMTIEEYKKWIWEEV